MKWNDDSRMSAHRPGPSSRKRPARPTRQNHLQVSTVSSSPRRETASATPSSPLPGHCPAQMVGENDAVSAMEEQPGPSTLVLGRPGCDSTIERLIYLQSALADLLCVVDDDGVADGCELGRRARAHPEHPHADEAVPAQRDPARFPPAAHLRRFRVARIAENDAHEIFAGDLERFRKRQRLNLGVVEADSDRCALVKRRRAYIATLLACPDRSRPSSPLRTGGASLPPEGRVATASDSQPSNPQ